MNRLTAEQSLLANQTLFQTKLVVYRCPSDSGPDLNGHAFNTVVATGGAVRNVITSNYVGNLGHSVGLDAVWSLSAVPALGPFTGIFSHLSNVRFRDITDGTTNTIMVGERAYFQLKPPHPLANPGDNVCSAALALVARGGTGGVTVSYNGSGYHHFGARGATLINGPIPRTGPVAGSGAAFNFPLNCGVGYGSTHTGGFHALLCDGSVRFLSETINHSPNTNTLALIDSLFERLLARDEGQVVEEF